MRIGYEWLWVGGGVLKGEGGGGFFGGGGGGGGGDTRLSSVRGHNLWITVTGLMGLFLC